MNEILSYFMTLKEVAADLRCSRGYIYWLMDHDPDFPLPVYHGNRPKIIRKEHEAYRRKKVAAQRHGAPRRGRPPKVAPVQEVIEN
ncbi:hypothetical protein LJR231_000307 [Phyllobacterium sp. LjRoot231]|uniref:helix-turn-helix transcriptional regulator n=1 Tax=Phyllobacterium sp. LjRoot231 TaxID=3342289 RepID=UPI003ECEAB18